MYKNILIHLGLIEDCGLSTVQKIIDVVGLDAIEDIYSFTVSDFIRLGFPEPKAHVLVTGLADTKLLDRELELIDQHNVTIVTRYCPEYSLLLGQIHMPPVVLYCQGDINVLQESKAIACVGARKAHRYVSDALQQIVVPMIDAGWVVVSGGAAGADTFAHKIALDHGGKTIVVVGTGLCHTYPPQNKQLFNLVLDQGGLIVSIFPMNTQGLPGCFPARNRIIAGLSQGCIVFQAASKSGALITATQALDQGREVFAVPGSIFDPLSAGCHDLIQQGAKLVTCAQDVLAELSYGQIAADIEQQANIFKIPQNKSEKSARTSQKKSKKTISNASLLYGHATIEQQIIDAVVVPMTADSLMQKFQLDLAHLQSILFALSLDGLVRQDGMGFWTRV